jgi:hypothetical protein
MIIFLLIIVGLLLAWFTKGNGGAILIGLIIVGLMYLITTKFELSDAGIGLLAMFFGASILGGIYLYLKKDMPKNK